MTGKIGNTAKTVHGHALPDHLNPAKQPNGALKNDHEAGPSGKARQKSDSDSRSSADSAVHPLAMWIGGWPAHGDGRPEVQGPAGRTLAEFLERPLTSSEAGSPPAPRQVSQAGSAPRKNPGSGQGHDLFPSGAGSEDLDLMNAVIGNPRKWGDLDAGIRTMKDEEARLDKNPFIAAHLDPEQQSPHHAKANWDKLPAPNHPLFTDYLIAQHPEYYASRLERRNSAPDPDDLHPPAADRNPPSPTPSLPADLSRLQLPDGGLQPLPPDLGVPSPRRQEAEATGHRPEAPLPHPEGGRTEPADARPDGSVLHDADGRPQGQGPSSNYKAYLAGIAGVGAGIVGGLIIASAVDDSSSNPRDNS